MLSQEKKVIICAGGTGGHVFPAKKLAELLLAKGVNIEWIGSSRGPEAVSYTHLTLPTI